MNMIENKDIHYQLPGYYATFALTKMAARDSPRVSREKEE